VTANAVSHQDNLEFLSDMVPKTVPFKKIKAQAAATRAQLNGQKTEVREEPQPIPNGKKHKASDRSSGSRASLNGTSGATISGILTGANARQLSEEEGAADPNDQLQLEASQARDDDVQMTG
jgi:DNA polymerase epsilon subunit 4